MHINNQKLSLDIFTVINVQNIFMEHDLNILMMFGIKEKSIILIIATNIPQRLKTDLVLQGHICSKVSQNKTNQNKIKCNDMNKNIIY